MNAKTFAKIKTIPAFKRLIENLEAGAPPLIIRDMFELFVDSYYRMTYGDKKGMRYICKHGGEGRPDADEGIAEIQKFLKELRQPMNKTVMTKTNRTKHCDTTLSDKSVIEVIVRQIVEQWCDDNEFIDLYSDSDDRSFIVLTDRDSE